MGTSEELKMEQRNTAGRPLNQLSAVAPSAAPNMAWPHEKLAEGDASHGDAHAMDVDPSYEGNEHMSPYASGNNSPFHYGDSAQQQQQQQQTYAGLVATPITRFLTKQTFGFIPKPSFPSPSESHLDHRKTPALRLPSLLPDGSLPQSPLNSPHKSFSLPAGETLSRLFGSASLDSNPRSAPGTPTSAASSPRTRPGSTVTLPPLKRACPSPTTLPSLSQTLSFDDICKPFRYQRSLSCPSDTMARAAAEEAAYEAYAAPRAMLQFSEVPKHRIERSNSMDVTAVIAAREAHRQALHGDGASGYHESSHASPHPDYHGWLDRGSSSHMNSRHPLASLAESAHAMQRLEERRQSQTSVESRDSPRGSPSESGGESANPFSVNGDEFKREKKLCAFPECMSNAVTRGLCISHGGGRRCQRKGCTRGAQSKGLCVAHGGGRICRAKGCSNIQRSMGLCIRHGGGKRCSVAGCQKGVVRQDLCTAHGGKRKCRVEDCNKHVKKKGLCRSHANSVLGSAAMSPNTDYMSGDNSD